MKESEKIIFLDVDGVLNCEKTQRVTRNGYLFVSGRKIKLLQKIVKETGAKIILSSDWRYNRDDPELNGDFLQLRDELNRYGIQISGYTPYISWPNRGREIDLWLKDNQEIKNFVILDDSNEVKGHADRFVHTTMKYGLTKDLAESAIKILNEAE